MDNRFNEKSLRDQVVHIKMTAIEQKCINQPLLLDSVPIQNYIFSLLHAEMGVGNKVVENHFLWITERMEKLLRKKLY